MLVTSGVIFMLETGGAENKAIAIAPYRLPTEPDPKTREARWPVLLPSNRRELVLKFELYVGCPAGLTERFASDSHRLGTARCS